MQARSRQLGDQLRDSQFQLTQALGEANALRAELEVQRQRAADLERALQSQGPGSAAAAAGGSRSAALASKKDEDSFDMESAVLTGGDALFKPLAGLIRGSAAGSAFPPLVRGAALFDRAVVALYRRPVSRVAIAIYIVLLHLWALL